MKAFVMRHRSTVTMVAFICAMAALVAWNEIGLERARSERRTLAASLACNQQIDALASLAALNDPARVAREIPGDELLIRYRTRLAQAAKRNNPNCVIPKELR